MYIADNHRIRKVTVSTGIITTYAGTGTGTYNGDDIQATNASLYSPQGVVLDASGIITFYLTRYYLYSCLLLYFPHLDNLYIADTSNQRIRKVTESTGIITTIAGNGASSYSADNGEATNVTMNYPVAVALDLSGRIS